MGWFDRPDATEPAVEDALRMASGKALPVTARSYTPAEFKGRHARIVWVMTGLYAGMVTLILLPVALSDSPADRDALPFAVPVAVIGGLVIFLAYRWRMRRTAGYRDPGFAVDVGADGIIVRGVGGEFGMRWHEIDARVNWMSIKSGIHFIGLWVESPLGLVDLRDETYRSGRIAAALIVRGMYDAYQAREAARIERIG